MKKIILWNYERGTWQYDIFCLLIIAFIFLTPKQWFEGKERDATPKSLSTVKSVDFLSVEKNNNLKIQKDNH
jgi:hypothetical protein